MQTKLLRKRIPTLLLASFTMLCALSGCTSKKDERLSVMIPLQKECFQRFVDLFLEDNPDVKFNLSAYRGGSPSAYLERRFEMNDLTDIVITSYPPDGAIQEDTLLDLSGHNFVRNYKSGVLANLRVNGHIYFLECPSSVRGIAYNKTMFEENHWEVPTSHEEFIALLKQIDEDSDVVPLGLQSKYPGTYFTLMSELSYCDFLQTPAGAEWMQKFAKGEVSSEDGFKYGLDLIKDWMDAGAFNPAHLDPEKLGDSTLYPKFVNDRWSAMAYMMGSQNKLVELVENAEDEFGVFPIYGTGTDSEFVATTYGLKIGLNKRLGEPGNEKKLQKALRLMSFLSTEEGQMAFHTGRGDILPLVGANSTLAPMFDEVNKVIERGHCAPFLYSGYEDIIASAGEYIQNACYNDGTLTGVYEVMDEKRRDHLQNQTVYAAMVSETLDEDQVAQFVANALHAQNYGDFALVSQGRYSRYFDVAGGANGKLYKGGISTMAANAPLTNNATKKAVTMELSGAEVKNLLEIGRVLKDDAGHEDAYVYYSAGIDVEYQKDGSVKSVIYQGAPLSDDQNYTVAFSPLDYSDEIASIGNPQEMTALWEADYLAYIKELGTITPQHAIK